MSAVSRTFTDGASVSEKTRSKVESAAAALGYQPSLIARGLATQRTKLIGLVADNFANPAFLVVFDLYTRTLQSRGQRPLLVNLGGQTDPAPAVKLMRQYSVDGVIVATSTLRPSFVRAFRDAGLKVVHAFGRATSRQAYDVVGIDNAAAGRMAAEALCDRGYRNVVFLGGPESATSTRDRLRGFAMGLAQHGRDPCRAVYAGAYTYEAGRLAARGLLGGSGLDAIFCGDDLIAMGAIDEARRAGLRIPEALGVIGFDDIPMASWAAYDLTTIRQPIDEIILRSVERIVDKIETPGRQSASVVLPCLLVERGTLRPPTSTKGPR